MDNFNSCSCQIRYVGLLSCKIACRKTPEGNPCRRSQAVGNNSEVRFEKIRQNAGIKHAYIFLTSSMPGSAAQAKALALGFVTSKSKRGTNETRVKTCRDCGLELCTGTLCHLGHYEFHTRLILDEDELEAEEKGFSLKGVIAAANAKPDKKAEEAKVRARRAAKKGPSLKAMLTAAKPRAKKKKKKKAKQKTE